MFLLNCWGVIGLLDVSDRNWECLRRLSKIVNWDKVKALNRAQRKSYYLENKDRRKDPFRSRVVMIELYPEHEEDMYFLHELIETDAYPYAVIIHDQDTFEEDKEPDSNGNGGHKKGDLKKLHLHCVVKFEHAKTNTAVAKMFLLNTQFVEMWDSCKEALGYLDHHKYSDKFHYSLQEIYGNLSGEVYQAHTYIPDKYNAFDAIANFIEEQIYTSMRAVYGFAKRRCLLDCFFTHWSKFNTLVLEHNSIQKVINENQKEGN